MRGGGQQDTANGELETKTNRDTDEAWLFQYDALGNLLTVGLPNGDLVEYLVDGMGRRVGKKKNGVLVKQWIYRDALKPVAELDGAGSLISEFVYGAKTNVPDYVRRGGATYRVISDQLGSPRYVVNVANASDVPFTASYTSFGEVTGLDWMPFGFAGGMYDGDSGLVRFGARDFDPLIGRWTSKDPIGFDSNEANLYRYAANDPIDLTDPTGQFVPLIIAVTPELIAAAAGVVAGVGWLAWAIGDVLDGASCDGARPAPPPREICRLINETETLCYYMCKPSGTLHVTDRPKHPITGETPHNDNCPRAAAGP